jgi:hypothetical protein
VLCLLSANRKLLRAYGAQTDSADSKYPSTSAGSMALLAAHEFRLRAAARLIDHARQAHAVRSIWKTASRSTKPGPTG